jgi:CrcB protein
VTSVAGVDPVVLPGIHLAVLAEIHPVVLTGVHPVVLAEVHPMVLVGLGGAAGAVLRSSVSRWLARPAFPLGTLAVNAVGTFLLGMVVLGGASDRTTLLVGVGFCGALTTFSSFAFETVRLWEDGRPWRAVLNAVGNLVVAGVAFLAAWALIWVLRAV